MKMLSRIFKIGFIFTLFLMTLAQARSIVSARGFSVVGLENFSGKKLSVFYVSARPATLEISGQIARVRKVLKGPLTYVINNNGEVSIPDTDVPRDGWTNFNHLIFVVHAQPKHALLNVDGSLPDQLDQENAVPFNQENAQFLLRKSLELNDLRDTITLF